MAQRLARAGVPRRRDSRDEAERFYDASPVSAREETLTAAADIQPTRFHDAGARAQGRACDTVKYVEAGSLICGD